MKKIFVECRYSGSFDFPSLKELPKNVGIAATVQYLDFLDDIQKKLIDEGKNPKILKTKQDYPGQILGCDVDFEDSGVDAILFIGDGLFHPTKIAYEHDIEVFIIESGKLRKIKSDVIEKYKRKKRAAMTKFLASESVGILFSIKPGQKHRYCVVDKLQKRYPDKTFYPIISDDIDLSSLADFNFIESWINTACPRIEEDFRCVNITDINKNI